MKLTTSKKSSFDLFKLYLISKSLSYEILLDEYLQSRGVYYSILSEKYLKNKNQLKRKILFTKLFYALIFGILPIIPIFAYFEYNDIIASGMFNFDLIIFLISNLYGAFFLLQFFNFLLMTIIETTVIMSGKSLGWFKTLPVSNLSLKKLMYVTIFRNFDIPILVIIFTFPIALLIVSANILFFLITLGISFINTFLGFNIMIIISGRLNRVLNLNDISSKKSFLIRLFNIFSYVFIILGSIYLIEWAATSIQDFFYLFDTTQSPLLINIILSIIPYPYSQSYLIALIFSPNYTGNQLPISTFIGMGLLVIILYLTLKRTFRSINKVIQSEPIYKHKETFLDNIKETLILKPTSTFRAFLRKDLLSATRDLKVFLSLISPIIFSFIFAVYLNLPRVSVSDPIELQILKTWLSYLLLTPILSGIIVFSLLNLDASGHSILESLPLIPREQAKAKLLIMFLVLTCAVLSPAILFITNPRFFIFFSGIIASLPFAWIFLFLSFEMSVYFFGKRNKTYIVSDLSGKSVFRWIVILFVPLSLCLWIISLSTLIFLYVSPFELLLSLFISLILIVGYAFNFLFFNKLLPIIKIHKNQSDYSLKGFRTIENPTFFTLHPWASVAILLIFDFVFNVISSYLTSFFHSITVQPIIWLSDSGYIEFLIFLAYYYGPLIVNNIVFILIYFILIPKKLGIPFGKKNTSEFLDDTGLSWIKPIYRNLRYIIFGSISIMIMMFFLNFSSDNWYPNYYIYEFLTLINIINVGIWIEITYRGLLLNVLTTKYKKRYAILLHLLIIFIYYYLFTGISSFPLMFNYDLSAFFYQLLFSILIVLGYHFIMDYIFIKARNLLPNIIITILFILFYYPISFPFYRII